MIRYALVCEAGHAFEAWFASSGAFAEQQQAGQVACAICGSSQIGKALMAPSLTSRRREAPEAAPGAGQPAAEAAAADEEGSTAGRDAAQPVPVAAHTDKREELIGLLRKLRRHVTENAEYVGKRFPEEARKIHYGETDKRGIYGEASAEEARELADEGIDFHPLPVLPEERN
jgi:hypothetical protein